MPLGPLLLFLPPALSLSSISPLCLSLSFSLSPFRHPPSFFDLSSIFLPTFPRHEFRSSSRFPLFDWIANTMHTRERIRREFVYVFSGVRTKRSSRYPEESSIRAVYANLPGIPFLPLPPLLFLLLLSPLLLLRLLRLVSSSSSSSSVAVAVAAAAATSPSSCSSNVGQKNESSPRMTRWSPVCAYTPECSPLVPSLRLRSR